MGCHQKLLHVSHKFSQTGSLVLAEILKLKGLTMIEWNSLAEL